MITKKTGVWLTLPEGKLPGYYAQIVKAIAGKTKLCDRDKDLLVFDGDEEADAAEEALASLRVACERLPLLLVPPEAALYPEAEDYGFTSRMGHHYFYAEQVFAFGLAAESAESEPLQAVRQMEEHLLCSVPEGEAASYIAPRQHDELMAGIAKAYRCRILERAIL